MLAPLDRELDASSSESEFGLEMKKIFFDGGACIPFAFVGGADVLCSVCGGDLRADWDSEVELVPVIVDAAPSSLRLGGLHAGREDSAEAGVGGGAMEPFCGLDSKTDVSNPLMYDLASKDGFEVGDTIVSLALWPLVLG
jgi:hypothetical protein